MGTNEAAKLGAYEDALNAMIGALIGSDAMCLATCPTSPEGVIKAILGHAGAAMSPDPNLLDFAGTPCLRPSMGMVALAQTASAYLTRTRLPIPSDYRPLRTLPEADKTWQQLYATWRGETLPQIAHRTHQLPQVSYPQAVAALASRIGEFADTITTPDAAPADWMDELCAVAATALRLGATEKTENKKAV